MPSQLQDLIDGYQQFKLQYKQEKPYFDSLVTNGQRPKALVIACCDSRVDPTILTQCKPGELFTVRNVANLVPPCEADLRHHGTSAALEFAVLGLQVRDIIILGHRYCGGIRALIESKPHESHSCFINSWMNIAKPAKKQVLAEHPEASLDDKAHACEKASLLISLENLKTFPWVAERLSQGKLNIHAWYFDLETGTLERYNTNKQAFEPL
jgi:carbonic anhydrase